MCDKENVIGAKCGTVTVSMYKDVNGSSFFYIQTDNEDVHSVADIIQDALYYF